MIFGFLTQEEKIYQKQKENQKYAQTDKQTNNHQHKQQADNQTSSQSIGSINAWTCCNAYA